MNRNELLKQLAGIILNVKRSHPVRVAIDGVDGSGKTFMANELAQELLSSGRQIIRVSVDGFHNPKKIRHQQGHNSPEGYYSDSFDNQAILQNVLEPLGPNGNLRYKKVVFDYKNNCQVLSPVKQADQHAILLMDGIFLQRPKLAEMWDLKIFLDVDFHFSVARAIKRDVGYGDSEHEIVVIYNERYVPGQKLYLKEANPMEIADIVVDNNDFENPFIKKVFAAQGEQL